MGSQGNSCGTGGWRSPAQCAAQGRANSEIRPGALSRWPLETSKDWEAPAEGSLCLCYILWCECCLDSWKGLLNAVRIPYSEHGKEAPAICVCSLFPFIHLRDKTKLIWKQFWERKFTCLSRPSNIVEFIITWRQSHDLARGRVSREGLNCNVKWNPLVLR